jgi:hypothetical protein
VLNTVCKCGGTEMGVILACDVTEFYLYNVVLSLLACEVGSIDVRVTFNCS